jgi:mRNA-degrading endonuclease RelE of RelBE toxin-antitoxin system
MDIFTTRPVEEIDELAFKNVKTNKEIEASPHAFDHLSAQQRKIFKEEELIHMLEKETPRKIYLQANGRYSVYYRKADGYRHVVLEVEDKKIIIVTFIDTLELPKIRINDG